MKRILASSLTAILLGFFGVSPLPVLAQQKNTDHFSQYWIRYFNRSQLNNKWTVQTEIELRRFAFPDRQHVWLLPRIQLTRALKSGWNVGAGITYNIQSQPQDPDLPVELRRPEIRLHQEINYRHGNKLDISHRYRIEERFIRRTSGAHLDDGYNFNVRFRYRIQLQYPLIRGTDNKGTLQAKLFDEIMLNAGKNVVSNVFDQNRIYAALNYSFSKNLQVELGYLNIFQEKSNGSDFLNTNVLRTTIYHTLTLY
ncbi:uncharacterized protein DUF2490 [Anseongella ginsenosidimutans]|uniref:Uncharacterized protein DUF2490 n=1 Tax=Anseongella ginsenosidimutans TaxID=496056 RepID=A0A4R3KNM4_9SPHI|nr:DUF2490 domain-containing protein [Anseongella ginsenosidimutans]QEC53648.1 DUF2490 domain-containing protein [Anseongella ginsenosidimutans]TCS86103.1 uncharacterized protein DUF2490 [Anseongella ginsenosidimutans]